ncbi:MAG: hypothetical protein ACT4P7_15770 [Gemmatimonadaceae bacterium]
MSVEVIFRGVSLFLTEDSRLKEVWVPDGETPKDKHPDGTTATKHYSRMVVLDANNNPAARADLSEAELTVSDNFGGECSLLPSFDQLPDFKRPQGAATKLPRLELISRKHPEFLERVTTTVQVTGGSMGSLGTQLTLWAIPQHPAERDKKEEARLAFQTVWRSQASTATLTIRDRNGYMWTELILDASRPKAYVYNFDSEWPTLGELSGSEEPPRSGEVIDEDFKWLYQLFTPPKNDWKTWLKNGPLPAPFSKLPVRAAGGIPRNPGSTGCFGARL